MLDPYSPFYNKTIRSYVLAFGNLFNGIFIQHRDSADTPVKTIKVPVSFAKKERYLTRALQDANPEGSETDPNIQMVLPRMAFDMIDLQYDSQRKTNGISRFSKMNTADGTNSTAITRRAGVPWNYVFDLYIAAKEIDEMYQIVEQILPWFQPHFNISVRDNKSFPESMDIPVEFNGITQEDSYEGDMRDGERRILIWTLSFTLRGYMYGPSETKPLIKQIESNYKDEGCNDLFTQVIKVEPWTSGPDDDYDISVEIIDHG